MKRKINSLSDLLMEELADLLNAENQLIEALPKMAEASQSLELKGLLEEHGGMTKIHADRLENIFSNIGQNPHRVDCKIMKKLIEDGEDIIERAEQGAARDSAIIGVAQRIEEYEIRDYGIAREHAEDLGHTRIMEVLDETLNEERTMKLHLSELAQMAINAQAIVSGVNYPRGGIRKRPKVADVSRFISEGNPNTQEDSDKDK